MKPSIFPREKLTIVLIAAFAAVAGCTSLRNAEYSLGDISKFLAAVGEAEEVVVYEGLPPKSSRLYAAEVNRPDLVWFEGYPFYAKPLAVSNDEKKRLTAIALDAENHIAIPPPSSDPNVIHLSKFCSGYHPDYAVVWTKGKKKSGSLICFGCGEWKNFTPEGRLYEDIDRETYDELRAILGKYAAQRPKEKPAGETPATAPR
jgi:hypothetical protein